MRKDLCKEVERQGGKTSGGSLSSRSTILVRGRWQENEAGKKERRAAEMIRHGSGISVVAAEEFQKLLERGRPAKVMDRVAGEPVEWLRGSTPREFRRAANVSGELDVLHSVLGRAEQAFLRRRLFGYADEACCALCGRTMPVALMIAAHIKPRSECSRAERLDAENIVFGVCLVGCDALYERGLISVKSGRIVTAPLGSKALRQLLQPYQRRKCPGWALSKKPYFDWHYQRRFAGH
ncbi:MAG: hypothetical protein ACRD28_00065 [Acidobacteriaceae bacterium]